MTLESRSARIWVLCLILVILFTLLGGLLGGASLALVTFLVLAGFVLVGYACVWLLKWVERGK